MHKMLRRPKETATPPPAPLPGNPFLKFPGRTYRYEAPTKEQMKLGLWVSSVGIHKGQPAHSLVQHRLPPCYQAILISGGKGYFQNAAVPRRNIGAGTLMWVIPGVEYSYSPQPAWDLHWISFGGRAADEFLRQGYIAPKRALVSVGDSPDVRGLFTRIEEVFLKPRPLSSALAAGILHQLIVTVHGINAGLLRTEERLDPSVCQAMSIMEREATKGLQPRAVAERVHEGYSTLRRRFHQQTGCSMKEYILRLQLRRACELLALTSMRVREVASETGFASQLYFARLFRSRQKCSPSEFRERHSGGIVF